MLEQLRDLRDRYGYDVSAIISTGTGGLVDKLKAEQIPFYQFDFAFPAAGQSYSLFTRVIELAQLFRRERYDVVQTHLFDSMVLGRLAAWLADVPVRLAMIAGPYHLEAHTPRWIDGSTWWMQTALLPSCEYTKQLYRKMGVPEARLFIAYYGPDENKFDPKTTRRTDLRRENEWADDTPLVGMVAYFYPPQSASMWTPPFLADRANKRHEDLVQAAPLILREFPNTHFLFVGSGWGEAGERHREKVRQMVYEAGLEDRFLFTGYRSDVNGILLDLDVSVQAALSENLGGTIESLLMECPTVASRVGGMVDSVRDGETGVLVEPLDPDSMAGGILRLLRDPEQAHQLAHNGRQLMLEHFTLKHTVDDLNDVYCNLLENTRTGYRGWILLRLVPLIPIFAYLAGRLFWDMSDPNRKLAVERLQDKRTQLLQSPPRLTVEVPRLHLHVAFPSLVGFIQPGARRLASLIVNSLKAFAHWLYLRPLYIYGDIRYRLRGTAVLRQWDKFFARIRGRKPC